MKKTQVHQSNYKMHCLKIGVAKVLLSFMLAMSLSCVYGQKLAYDVVKGRKTIGKMTVERIRVADTIKYNIESRVEFNLILSFKIDFLSQEFFVDDVLIDGFAESRLNGKPQKKSIVKGDGQKYVVNVNGSPVTLSNKQIKRSIPLLYFDMPESKTTIFSQQFSEFLPIQQVEEGVFELTSPDGKNVYRYENNTCVEVQVFRTYANFSFKLVR